MTEPEKIICASCRIEFAPKYPKHTLCPQCWRYHCVGMKIAFEKDAIEMWDTPMKSTGGTPSA